MYIGRRTGSRLEERRDRTKSTHIHTEEKKRREKREDPRREGAVRSETERGRKQTGGKGRGRGSEKEKRRERLVERESRMYTGSSVR